MPQFDFQRPRLRRLLAAVRPGDLGVPCLDLFMNTPRHSSLQNRCASPLSSLPQASHLAIARLLRHHARSWPPLPPSPPPPSRSVTTVADSTAPASMNISRRRSLEVENDRLPNEKFVRHRSLRLILPKEKAHDEPTAAPDPPTMAPVRRGR